MVSTECRIVVTKIRLSFGVMKQNTAGKRRKKLCKNFKMNIF